MWRLSRDDKSCDLNEPDEQQLLNCPKFMGQHNISFMPRIAAIKQGRNMMERFGKIRWTKSPMLIVVIAMSLAVIFARDALWNIVSSSAVAQTKQPTVTPQKPALKPIEVTEKKVTTTSDPRITFGDTNRTSCYYRNNYFEKNVQASYFLESDNSSTFVQSDPETLRIDLPTVGKFGRYDANGVTAQRMLSVMCDGHLYTVLIDSASLDVSLSGPSGNRPPVVSSFQAKVLGTNVVGATMSSSVTLVASVTDPDGDALKYTWASNAGSITSTPGNNTAIWKLPNSKGLNFAYVLVTDGKGGYTEAVLTVSTDAGQVNGSQPPHVNASSDKVPFADHFLTFFSTKNSTGYLPAASPGADSKMGSCRYYVAIGAARGCDDRGNLIGPLVNFSSWKQNWGFGDATPTNRCPNAAAGEKCAIYANKIDLNLERDMHGITTSFGTAYYVCNYPRSQSDLNNALNQKNLVACVAMEYQTVIPDPSLNPNIAKAKISIHPGPITIPEPYVKFYVFSPAGSLLQSVNLDGRGEKYIPGSCVVCHGAKHEFTRFAENGTTSPNLNAKFLPFDLNNFDFSTAFSSTDMQTALRALNQGVLNTGPTTEPASEIQKLVKGWYGDTTTTPKPTLTGNFEATGLFVPSEWQQGAVTESSITLSASQTADLYKNVVRQYCRSCHIAMDSNKDFAGVGSFIASDNKLASHVCGNRNDSDKNESKLYAMPNSKVTFDKFWADPVAISTLQSILPTGTNCSLPP
jgi:hypothetical protein